MKSSKLFRSVIAILLAVMFTIPAGASVKAEASSYKTGIYKINTQSSPLNVRSCYGSEYMKVGEVPKGTKVNVTFVSSNGWGRIVYKDAHGWISLEYCKYVGPYEEEEPGASASSVDERTFAVSAGNLLWVTGWKQEFSRSSGLCTSSATASLLRRRQAAEQKEVSFTFGDVRSALGGDPIPDQKGYYASCNSYFTDTTPFTHRNGDGTEVTYYLHKDTVNTHSRNREYLADLLDVHPEGVVVYTAYGSSGRHAILISDYVRNKDGSLQFYAYDPANGTGRCRLENTWVMTKCGSVGSFFANMISIWYVQGELTVDDDYFAHPEAEVFDGGIFTAKKKTYAYSSADTGSERVRIHKGDEVTVGYRFVSEDGTVWYITDEGYFILAAKFKSM